MLYRWSYIIYEIEFMKFIIRRITNIKLNMFMVFCVSTSGMLWTGEASGRD